MRGQAKINEQSLVHAVQEVSSAHSTDRRRNLNCALPIGKEQTQASPLPVLDKHPLQAKKATNYRLFREVVLMICRKEHLIAEGVLKIQAIRKEMRKNGKKQKMGTARIRENRSSGGVDNT
jgi:hypothetical protein